jgi:UDP-glucuronate 4-epimerase
MRVLVTGSAGFIGFHLARRLLAEGNEIVGVDGLTPYYDVGLKRARHDILKRRPSFTEAVLMLEDEGALAAVCTRFEPEAIIHLAGQAGVRYSLEEPRAYVDANLVGTFNLIEAARIGGVRHLMLASSSSIYGASEKTPFLETDPSDQPLTFYAATKKATELMSHSYSHLWNIPTTVVRLFSVYGPWGRPDMALYKFAEAMTAGRTIDVYNHGQTTRDFTYVDDVVMAIDLLLHRHPVQGMALEGDSLSLAAPWRVVNIGAGAPCRLTDLIAEIERGLALTAQRNDLPGQPGDAPASFADVSLLARLTGYRPDTPLRVGVAAFCDWYRDYVRSSPAPAERFQLI